MSHVFFNEIRDRSLDYCERFGLYVPEPVVASWLDREAWLLTRPKSIGSSEVWKLFSEDPEDRTSLFESKIGDPLAGEDEELSADLERGRLFESIAALKYSEESGSELIELPTLCLEEEPRISTSVDRIILPGTGTGSFSRDEPGCWEAKVPRWHMFSKYRRHGLPERIIWQAQNHMLVTGFEYCVFCAFNADSLSLLHWPIERDEAMIAAIREEVPRFFDEFIDPRIPPETNEIPVEGFVVPEVEGVVVTKDDEDWKAAAELFRHADPLYKEAKSLRDEAVKALKALVGTEPGEYEGEGVRGVLSMTEGRFDGNKTLDRIADAWPLDSDKFKELCRSGELRNEDGEKLSDGDINSLSNALSLDVYSLKVKGNPGFRFVPRVLSDD